MKVRTTWKVTFLTGQPFKEVNNEAMVTASNYIEAQRLALIEIQSRDPGFSSKDVWGVTLLKWNDK